VRLPSTLADSGFAAIAAREFRANKQTLSARANEFDRRMILADYSLYRAGKDAGTESRVSKFCS
jgi:hypothetical protein